MTNSQPRLRRTLTAAALALFCLVAWSAPAFACPACGKGRGGKDPMKRIEQNAEELGLADQQLAEMRALVDAGAPERQQLADQIKEGRARLHALMQTDSPDPALVIDQVEALGALETRQNVERFRTKLELRNLMTAEQHAKLRALMMAKRGERGAHKKHAGQCTGDPATCGGCQGGDAASCPACKGDPANCPRHAAKKAGADGQYECQRAKAAREAAAAAQDG